MKRFDRKMTARAFGAVVLGAMILLGNAAVAGDDAGTPGAYLRYGSSARSLSLGNAVGGIADDAATSYWNPAGFASLRTMELAAMGASLGMDTNYGFVTLGMPTATWGTFALSGTYTSSGDYQRTDLFTDLDETFTEDEGIFSLGWGKGFGRLSVGLNLKTVRQNIGGASGSGTGLDLGFHYRPHRALGIGFAVQNAIAPKIVLIEDEEQLPRSLRGGLALGFFKNRMQMSADVVRTEWMDTSAWLIRPSSLRSQWVWEPSPGGRPRSTAPTTPPMVSPASRAARNSTCSLSRRSTSAAIDAVMWLNVPARRPSSSSEATSTRAE